MSKSIHKVSFWLAETPIGKGRPRFTRAGRVFTPKKTKDFELKIAARASDEMVSLGIDPFTVPCKVYILAQFPIPKSWPKKRVEAATRGEVVPGKPDIDNVAKLVLDALNGVCFEDDKLVQTLKITKKYGQPLLLVQVEAET
jgi:Holliday junction resolvase RusA-like endonuclease